MPLSPAQKDGLKRYNEKNQLVRVDRDTYNKLLGYSGENKLPIKEIIKISVREYIEVREFVKKVKNNGEK